jgi:hypothetical protein
MSDKYYFYGWISTPKTEQRITILSVGDQRSQLAEGKFYPAGSLDKLRDTFKAMVLKGKAPFNFRWSPYVDKTRKVNQSTLFRTLSRNDRSTIELRIQSFDANGNRHNTRHWNFYDVAVIDARPSGKNEVVETHFSKFDMGSNQL